MKWLTAVFIVLLILIIIIANLGLGPSFFPFIYLIPGADKIGHFFLMGILSYLINSLLKSRVLRLLSKEFLVGSLIVLVVVTIEELSQLFLENRAFSVIDLLFDYAGIIIFGRISAFISNKQIKRQDLDNIE
jgi:VanZ family protein